MLDGYYVLGIRLVNLGALVGLWGCESGLLVALRWSWVSLLPSLEQLGHLKEFVGGEFQGDL